MRGTGQFLELLRWKGRIHQVYTALTANIITITYGLVHGWPSPSLPLLRSKDTSLGNEPITQEQESWLGSLLFLGAFLFSPVYSYINQNYGRKAAGYLTAVPAIIGYLLIIFGDSIIYYYSARFLMGAILAGVNVFITMYVGETSEDCIRGALGNIRGIASDIGLILVYAVGSYFSIVNTGIVCICIPVIFLASFLWLPESPMYLLGKGNRQLALKSYLWLRDGDVILAEEEMKKLRAVVDNSKTEVTVMELLAGRGTRRALLISLVLAVVQQFSGINVIYSYCASIFEMTGSNFSPEISSMVLSIIGLAGSMMSFFLSDIAGRRFVLISTQLLQGVCLGVLAIYLYARHLDLDVSIVGMLPVVCISFYCFFAVAGPANLSFVVMSEIFRPEARGLATSVTNSLLWILAFASTKLYPSMIDLLHPYGCYSLFAAVSFAGAIYTFFQLPETKNRSLESILRELNGDISEETAVNV